MYIQKSISQIIKTTLFCILIIQLCLFNYFSIAFAEQFKQSNIYHIQYGNINIESPNINKQPFSSSNLELNSQLRLNSQLKINGDKMDDVINEKKKSIKDTTNRVVNFVTDLINKITNTFQKVLDILHSGIKIVKDLINKF